MFKILAFDDDDDDDYDNNMTYQTNILILAKYWHSFVCPRRTWNIKEKKKKFRIWCICE